MSTELRLAEVDRQLGEQRSQSDAFASRSGLMIASSSVLTGLIATGAFKGDGRVESLTIWAFGASALLGIAVLCLSRLVLGPSPSALRVENGNDHLLAAKLLAIEANGTCLTRAEFAFFLQAASSVVGVIQLVLALQRMGS
jgi:hypothetical protein